MQYTQFPLLPLTHSSHKVYAESTAALNALLLISPEL